MAARGLRLLLQSRTRLPAAATHPLAAGLRRAADHSLLGRRTFAAGSQSVPRAAQPACQHLPHQNQQRRQSTASATAPSAGASSVQQPTQMDEDVRQLVLLIHDNPAQLVLYAAGGGLQALNWLLTTPGASRTVLDARVPYSQSALAGILGAAPTTYASPETARAMATAAYRAAAGLAPFGVPLIGLGCSCALATDRPKRGNHKVVIAAHTAAGLAHWAVTLEKGARQRGGEDTLASRLLLRAVAHAAGLPCDLASGLQAGKDGELQVVEDEMSEPLQALLDSRVRTVEFSGGQVVMDAPRPGRVYLPGSFNPMHEGHRKLLAAGCIATGGRLDGCYEMSVGNPDKGMLPLEEVQRRVQPFLESGDPLVVTQAPLYSDKAELFPNATFVVGYDTAIRLVDPKYYGGNDGTLLSMAALRHRGCRILVAGRAADAGKGGDGATDGSPPEFLTLRDLHLSEALASLELFQEIPESGFRADISSTQLRREEELKPTATS